MWNDRAREVYRQALGTLFVLAVPLLLLAGSVAWAVNDAGLYQRGFHKYGISRATGIPPKDLHQAGAAIRRYFNSGVEPLTVQAPVWGREQELFNQRESRHMRDVKALVRGDYLVAAISLLYVLGVVTGGLAGGGTAFLRPLARFALLGGLLTLVLLAAVGLLAVAGFEALFRTFHHLSFSNDLWQLDPQRDYLIMMFPLGFWFDATLQVAAIAVLSATALSAGAGVYLLFRRWADGNPRLGKAWRWKKWRGRPGPESPQGTPPAGGVSARSRSARRSTRRLPRESSG